MIEINSFHYSDRKLFCDLTVKKCFLTIKKVLQVK